MKLVEQELWQREEKGLIGILPVRDAAEKTSVDSVLSQGFCLWTCSVIKKYSFHCLCLKVCP